MYRYFQRIEINVHRINNSENNIITSTRKEKKWKIFLKRKQNMDRECDKKFAQQLVTT